MDKPNIKLIKINHLHQRCKDILESNDPVYIENNFKEILEYYELINFKLSGYEHFLWRGRKCATKDGFDNIQELSYPPANITKIGRLNEKNSPIYYASLMIPTVLEEIHAADGDYIHIVGSKIKSPIHGCIVGEFTNVHRTGKGLMLSSQEENIIKNIFSKLPQHALSSFLYIDSFISSVLRDKDASKNNYLHSRIFGKLLMNSLSSINAIFYPSVALEGSMNVAILPANIDNSLERKVSMVIHIKKRYEYGIFNQEIVKDAHGENKLGEIKWSQ